MKWWLRFLFIFCDLCVVMAALAGPPVQEVGEVVPSDTAARISEEANTNLYDCTVTLHPAAALSAESAVRITLESGDAGAATRVTITRDLLAIDAVTATGTTRCAEAPSGVVLDKPYSLTILRRGGWMGVLHGEDFLVRGKVPHPSGEESTITPGEGWKVVEMDLQPLEPVAFTDNFMRTEDEPGAWKVVGGKWTLQSAWDNDPKGGGGKFTNAVYGQNPFAWVGRAPTGSTACCMAGEAFWDSYTLTTAIRPPVEGAIGVVVNAIDPTHCLLVRWTPANTQHATGNRLALYSVVDGKHTLLAETSGGYLPEQWYRMSVSSTLEGVAVMIDGRERLAVKDAMPCRGGVGLYAEGTAGAIFDDVTVYGHTLKTELIAEHQLARFNQRIAEDDMAMSAWASAAQDWMPLRSVFMHRWDYFGDQRITLTMQPTGTSGEMWLALNTNGADPTSGYRAIIRRAPGGGQITYILLCGATKVAEKHGGPLTNGEEYGFRFAYVGNRLRLELDGETVLEANNVAPIATTRPAFRADGGFAKVSEVLVLGRNVLDYSFADAPTDWIGQGTWMPTTRWACTPQWSFLGGWSRGEAALWHKQRFTGDQSFEAYVATKMEYPREKQTYVNRFRDYGLTICGDGHHPRSGYTLIYGAPDCYGSPNRRTVLLRNGVEVTSSPVACPGWGRGGHTQWYGLALHKRGALITATLNGNTLLSYSDPAPIAGGIPAIWTSNNGVAIARARLHFANPPQPRTDPLVVLDEPWVPEWANLNQPLSLTFSGCWTTSGKAATLRTESCKVPTGKPPLFDVREQQVLCTPQSVGEHWFRVTASDGAAESAPVDIALPVFNPALKRDDSRTLVLYRFDEASGSVIRDQGAIGPKADLAIPSGARVRRLPGQGLAFQGINKLVAEKNTEKLMAIAEKKACTIELWVSLDTIFPPTEWLGYLLAWEKPGNPKQNFAFMHGRESLYFLADTTLMQPIGVYNYPAARNMAYGGEIRTGLQHLAVTWDGARTSTYINGRMAGIRTIPWNTGGWSADAPLVLGSHLNPHKRRTREFADFYQVGAVVLEPQPDGPNGMLGAYYFAAIHDRCLPPDEIRRNYQAGPSAR